MEYKLEFNKWYFFKDSNGTHYELITTMLSGRESGGDKHYVGWWLERVGVCIQVNEWASLRNDCILKEPKLNEPNKKKMIRDIFSI